MSRNRKNRELYQIHWKDGHELNHGQTVTTLCIIFQY